MLQLHPDTKSGLAFVLLQVVHLLASVHVAHSESHVRHEFAAVSDPVL